MSLLSLSLVCVRCLLLSVCCPGFCSAVIQMCWLTLAGLCPTFLTAPMRRSRQSLTLGCAADWWSCSCKKIIVLHPARILCLGLDVVLLLLHIASFNSRGLGTYETCFWTATTQLSLSLLSHLYITHPLLEFPPEFTDFISWVASHEMIYKACDWSEFPGTLNQCHKSFTIQVSVYTLIQAQETHVFVKAGRGSHCSPWFNNFTTLLFSPESLQQTWWEQNGSTHKATVATCMGNSHHSEMVLSWSFGDVHCCLKLDKLNLCLHFLSKLMQSTDITDNL